MEKLICVDNEGMEKFLKIGEEYECQGENDYEYLVVLEGEVKWLRKSRFREVGYKKYLDMLRFLLGLGILLMILEKIIK